MHNPYPHLELTIDGKLKVDKPIPGRFLLKNGNASKELDPNKFISLGKLLPILRNSPSHERATALRYIQSVLQDDELVNAVFLSKLKLDLTINDGEGNCGVSLDIIQAIKEMQNNGHQVWTYAPEKAISAGAYIWMEGDHLYTTDDADLLWHTGHPNDLPIMMAFFDKAQEPLRRAFLNAIAKNDKACHEITTKGRVLVRAGLAKFM